MTSWILEFFAGLALLSLALTGFVIVAIVFLRWLDGVASFEQLSRSAETQIDQLRDEAVGGMFDAARAARLEGNAAAVEGDVK